MPIYKYILILTFFVALLQTINGKKSVFYFVHFIVFVVIVEVIVSPLYYNKYGDNLIILNLYSRICIYYYLFIFSSVNKDKTFIRWYKWVLSVYIIGTLLFYFIKMPSKNLDYISYNLGMILLFPLILSYLHSLIYNFKYENLRLNPYIYFAFGILIFYTSSFPIVGLINILIVNNPKYEIYTFLLNLGNIFLGLAYLGVALCSTNRTYTSA